MWASAGNSQLADARIIHQRKPLTRTPRDEETDPDVSSKKQLGKGKRSSKTPGAGGCAGHWAPWCCRARRSGSLGNWDNPEEFQARTVFHLWFQNVKIFVSSNGIYRQLERVHLCSDWRDKQSFHTQGSKTLVWIAVLVLSSEETGRKECDMSVLLTSKSLGDAPLHVEEREFIAIVKFRRGDFLNNVGRAFL